MQQQVFIRFDFMRCGNIQRFSGGVAKTPSFVIEALAAFPSHITISREENRKFVLHDEKILSKLNKKRVSKRRVDAQGFSQGRDLTHIFILTQKKSQPYNQYWLIATTQPTSGRLPTAPGKPGKTGPDLETLEKQGVFFGKNLEKYYKTWKKIFTSPWKSPKASAEKVSEKYPQLKQEVLDFFYLFGQRFENYCFLLELQKCSSDVKNSFQTWVLRIKNVKYFNQNWLTCYFPIHNQQKWEKSKFCSIISTQSLPKTSNNSKIYI